VVGDTANQNLPGNHWTLYGSGLGAARTSPSYNWAVYGITQDGTFVDFDVTAEQLTLSGGASPTSGFILSSGNLQVYLTSHGGFVTFWAAIFSGGQWTITSGGTQPATMPYYLSIHKRGNQYTGYYNSTYNLGRFSAPYRVN